MPDQPPCELRSGSLVRSPRLEAIDPCRMDRDPQRRIGDPGHRVQDPCRWDRNPGRRVCAPDHEYRDPRHGMHGPGRWMHDPRQWDRDPDRWDRAPEGVAGRLDIWYRLIISEIGGRWRNTLDFTLSSALLRRNQCRKLKKTQHQTSNPPQSMQSRMPLGQIRER